MSVGDMSKNTNIEWCHHTFNPWIGCAAISPGCTNCYAAAWAKRCGRDFSERTRTKTWGDPIKWNADHEMFYAEHGCRQRVFCASLADVFDNAVDPQWRVDLFELIEKTPNIDWLLLTKRIGNVMAMIEDACQCIDHGEGWQSMWAQGQWPANVWLGATIVNQEEADRDIPKLLDVPARIRFLSIEPLLSHVDLTPMFEYRADVWNDTGVHWVIAGGESGPGARPMHPDFARSLRDQCAAAGVPFFMKQLSGEKGKPIKDIYLFPSDLQVREYPNANS